MTSFEIFFWIILAGTSILTMFIFKSIYKGATRFSLLTSLKTILLSSIFLWVSLFLSYKTLSGIPTAPDFIGSTAGFPFLAFKIPVACLGHDVPPVNQWTPFFLNFTILHIVAMLVTAFYYKKYTPKHITSRIENGASSSLKTSNIYLEIFLSIALLTVILLFNGFLLFWVSMAFD